MSANRCIAMVLAGGAGERLGALTHYYSKPAVHFGNKHRIIDFTLNNCRNSGISTVGILSQYFSNDLNAYISYHRNPSDGDITVLSSKSSKEYYRGGADAVYRNIDFIEQFNPDCVLILSGDHIYDMDYRNIIAFHQDIGADATIGSSRVPLKEISKFRIVVADRDRRVRYLEEHPDHSESDTASMGIYVFKWDKLKKYLLECVRSRKERHNFEKDVLPEMLRSGNSVYTFLFDGYWRDVGTVESLWEANMDHINFSTSAELQDSVFTGGMPCCIGNNATLHRSVISEGCSIFGHVEHSVLSNAVTVYKGAEIIDSVIMPGAYIGANAKIYKAIVGTKAVIMDNVVIGAGIGQDFFVDHNICSKDISLVAPWLHIRENMSFQTGSHIYAERLQKWMEYKNAMKTTANPSPSEKKRRDYAVAVTV